MCRICLLLSACCRRAALSAGAAQVSISTDPFAVMTDADWALMIGAKPRGPGQERADLLDQNGRIFVVQGRARVVGGSTCGKVMVVGAGEVQRIALGVGCAGHPMMHRV